MFNCFPCSQVARPVSGTVFTCFSKGVTTRNSLKQECCRVSDSDFSWELKPFRLSLCFLQLFIANTPPSVVYVHVSYVLHSDDCHCLWSELYVRWHLPWFQGKILAWTSITEVEGVRWGQCCWTLRRDFWSFVYESLKGPLCNSSIHPMTDDASRKNKPMMIDNTNWIFPKYLK